MRWGRIGRWWACVLLATMTLAACGTPSGSLGSGTTVSTPGASARATDTPSTSTLIPVGNPAGTPSPFDDVICSANATSSSFETITRSGDLQLATYLDAGYYANTVQVPDSTPLAPVKVELGANGVVVPSSWFGPVNSALLFRVCNLSNTHAHTLQAVSVRLSALSPYTGHLNAWDRCSDLYSRSGGAGHVCGDSGWSGPSHWFDATFAPGATVGSTVDAMYHSPAAYEFPVTLPPGKGIVLGISIATYPTPGTYRFTAGMSVDGQAPVFAADTRAVLYAPVAHTWAGQYCTSSAMQAHIPPATNPPSYYICPQST